MKRFTIACLIALLPGSAVAFAAAPSSPSTGTSPPPAHLRQFVCRTGLDPAMRAISITSVMRPVPGTEHMALRYVLLMRARRHAPTMAVKGTNLGGWIKPSNPTLGSQPGDRWVDRHPVVDLAAPDFYRFKVTFRWTGAGGKVLAKTQRVSPVCFEPELRPDLDVVAFKIQPGPLNQANDVYVASIRNRGKTAAGAFGVELSSGTQDIATKQVPGLGSHQHIRVTFHAPACTSGQQMTITADPTDQVDEYNRANNVLTVACP